jgi:hypothetical protein
MVILPVVAWGMRSKSGRKTRVSRVCHSAILTDVQRMSHLGRLPYPFVLLETVGLETACVG